MVEVSPEENCWTYFGVTYGKQYPHEDPYNSSDWASDYAKLIPCPYCNYVPNLALGRDQKNRPYCFECADVVTGTPYPWYRDERNGKLWHTDPPDD